MEVKYTAEELLLDESFVDYCQTINSVYTEKWESIIAQYPGQQKAIDEARELLGLLSPAVSAEEIAIEVQKLRQLMKEKTKQGAESISLVTDPVVLYVDAAGKLRRKKMRRLAIICGLVLLTGASILPFINSGKVKKYPVTVASTYKTGTGERKQFRLPDGSMVILNSNSHISINTDFDQKERRVQLTGEAFFSVTKNADHPFIVSSNQFSTTAIGTAFYVDSRPNAAAYKVTLLEGKVKLNEASDASPSFLDAGEEASWASDQKAFAKNNFDTASLRQWLSGRISFSKVPVAQAFAELQTWYGVEIEDQRKGKKNISISGDYVNQPLEDILKVICFSLSCKYQFSGDKIIIQ